MIIESFSENDDDIISLRTMIEIISKKIMFRIIPLEMIMISFSGNNNVKSFSKK